MKAAVYTRYGNPDVVQVREIATPAPKDNEILVKIHTTTVAPTDCAFRKAQPFITRFMNGLRKPGKTILGSSLAGEVEAVGKDVTKFRKGDLVYGSTTADFGAHADYICLPETGTITHKPDTITMEEGACVHEALTPLYFLSTLANLRGGQHVLINGASGALGTYGIQIAKILGAEVTGVCSTANLELVRSLGADHVIDYTLADFTAARETYDVIFDAVGKSAFSHCQRALKPRGLYLTTVMTPGGILQSIRTSVSGGKKAKIGLAGLNVTDENLQTLHGLVAAGKIRTVIDRRYPLAQIADAHRYVDTGRKRGNVIINVAG